MRHLHFMPVIIIFLLAGITQANAQKNDEAAIKKVLQQETSTYFHKNYDGWADTWLHDTATSVLRASTNSYTQLLGWNAIAAEYKKDIEGLSVRNDAEIAPFLNKTDYHIYINGNVATATFREGDKIPNTEMRTLVKQNGTWKILNFTLIDNASYAMSDIMNTMNSLVGKWELDGKATMEPTNGRELNSIKYEMRKTSNGFEQLSTFAVTYKNQTLAQPTSHEYFIPDYSTNTIFYTSVYKDYSGKTYPGTGIISSDKPNSFTVTQMYPDKPDAIETEYTVTLENGKWHQVGKHYDRDGKQNMTGTMDLRRVVE
ncbi:MAG: hypothetical protein ABI237_02730 [Ginsengibacter sp.]